MKYPAQHIPAKLIGAHEKQRGGRIHAQKLSGRPDTQNLLWLSLGEKAQYKPFAAIFMVVTGGRWELDLPVNEGTRQ